MMRRKKNDDQPKLFGDPEPKPKWQVREDFPITSPTARKRAEARRDRGIERAESHAESVNAKWRQEAFDALNLWLRDHHGKWLTEEVVEWTKKAGTCTPPPTDRSWGGVIRRAAKAGLITSVGAAPANTSNRGLKMLWQGTEYL